MALINKIRQKSGWAVGIVAIALGLFVVGGDILGPSSVILGKNKTDVGEIAGEVIEREAYQYEIDMMKNNYMVNRGTNPSEAEMYTIRQQAWEYLIVKTAFQASQDIGHDPKIIGMGSLTDAIHLINYAKTPTVTIGPGGGGYHEPDEFVRIDSLMSTAKIVALCLMRWCGYG